MMNRKEFLGKAAYWYHIELYKIHVLMRWSMSYKRYAMIQFERCPLPEKSCIMGSYPYRITSSGLKKIARHFDVDREIGSFF